MLVNQAIDQHFRQTTMLMSRLLARRPLGRSTLLEKMFKRVPDFPQRNLRESKRLVAVRESFF